MTRISLTCTVELRHSTILIAVPRFLDLYIKEGDSKYADQKSYISDKKMQKHPAQKEFHLSPTQVSTECLQTSPVLLCNKIEI